MAAGPRQFIMCRSDVNFLSEERLKGAKELLSWNTRLGDMEIEELKKGFWFKDKEKRLRESAWLEEVALSPRGRVGRKSSHHRAKPGFTCCTACLKSIQQGKVPLYAIANRNYVGCPPSCLSTLREVELALLTPMQCHGYCFSYVGGRQKNLKGTLVFMRVRETRIRAAVTQLEAMGLTKHMLVLFNGKMTEGQRRKAREETRIRTEKVIEAVKWLCANNKKWEHVDPAKLLANVNGVQPVVVDNSSTVESGNANVEEEELFTCYYPDGASNPVNGGFDKPGSFKKYVEDMQKKGFEVEFKVNLQKGFVKGNQDDQLVSSSLLQFPYGMGGLEESRGFGRRNCNGQDKVTAIPRAPVETVTTGVPAFNVPVDLLHADIEIQADETVSVTAQRGDSREEPCRGVERRRCLSCGEGKASRELAPRNEG